jgi:putative aldouronate transport system substrate-binding protein
MHRTTARFQVLINLIGKGESMNNWRIRQTAIGGMMVLLAVILIMSGCAKEQEKSGTQASGEASSPAVVQPKEEPAKDKKEEKRGSISATIYDRGNIPASEGTVENNRWTKWINANSPVDVKFVPITRSAAAEKVNVLFASGKAPDLVFEYDPAVKNSLYEQKQLMPLDDLIANYSVAYKAFLEKYPSVSKTGMKSDRKIYEFGKLNEAVPMNVIIIRNDWLKKLNLPVPTTTEQLLQTAIAFSTQDPDGNNKKDTYGIALKYDLGGNLANVFGVDWVMAADGTMSYPLDRQKALIDFEKALYEGGVVDKDFLTDKNGAKAKQDFLNGKLGIYIPQANTFNLWYELFVTNYDTIKQNDPNAELSIIPYPESPQGQFMSGLQNPLQMTAVVNAATKDPEAVMKYIDFLVTEQSGVTLSSGIEGEHWRKGKNSCPEVIDQDKYKTEVSYHAGVDYDMVYSKTVSGTCGYLASSFNPDVPEEKAAFDLFRISMNDMYQTDISAYSLIPNYEHAPTLPNDLKVAMENVQTKSLEIWTKALLGGTNYTSDQALADVKTLWDREGGTKAAEYYTNWYAENKDRAFVKQDMYDIVQEQKKTNLELLK